MNDNRNEAGCGAWVIVAIYLLGALAMWGYQKNSPYPSNCVLRCQALHDVGDVMASLIWPVWVAKNISTHLWRVHWFEERS